MSASSRRGGCDGGVVIPLMARVVWVICITRGPQSRPQYAMILVSYQRRSGRPEEQMDSGHMAPVDPPCIDHGGCQNCGPVSGTLHKSVYDMELETSGTQEGAAM